MRISETRLAGAFLIEIEPKWDQRGFFARTFCVQEFAAHGLVASFVQHSMSYSSARGTLRGMHFQRSPHSEIKVVGCHRGAIWDVIIDLRAGSPTFGQWEGFELSDSNRRRLYIPEGFAHGLQTLSEDAEVSYLISAFHNPAAAAGFRFDDPAFSISWPLPAAAVSDADRNWPDFLGSSLPLDGPANTARAPRLSGFRSTPL